MRVQTLNLDFHAGSNRLLLRHACKDADILLVQEAKDVDLAAALPEGWRTTQDLSSPDRAGSAICWNNAVIRVHEHGLILGAKPFIGGKKIKMLTRWIAWADVTDLDTGAVARVFSCHYPPFRFRVLMPGM